MRARAKPRPGQGRRLRDGVAWRRYAGSDGAQARDADVSVGGEHDLDDAGDGEPAALPMPGGPGWRPRTSSQAETSSRARLDSGTERTSFPLPYRQTSPVRAVIAKSPASRRPHSSTRAPASSSTAMMAESHGPLREAARQSAASLPTGERTRLAGPGDADPLHGDAEANLLVHQRDGGQGLVDRRG
jgi:hypothetical protein